MAIQAIIAGVGVGLQAYSAYQAYQEGKDLKDKYSAAGRLLKSENYRQAATIREDANRFAQQQKMTYFATGVQYAGSALVTVAQTKAWGEAEATAQEKRGDATAEYYNDLGRQSASEGRAQLISGLFKAGAGAIGGMK